RTIAPPAGPTLFPYTTLFRSADGRADGDADGEVEVAHEALDHERLLGILLTEVGDVGPHDVEELCHYGGDAGEVAGPAVGALERSEEHTSELQSRSDLVCRLL